MVNYNSSIITLFEWRSTRYKIAEIAFQTSDTLLLTHDFFDALTDIDPKQQIFRYTATMITPQKYIGLIQIKNIIIQILPKFHDKMNCEANDEIIILNKNLFLMISFGISSFWKTRDMYFDDFNNSEIFENFFECLLHFYITGLVQLLSRNQHRDYIIRNNNLRFLKEKINLTKYGNPSKIHIFPCIFHEYSPNSIINRTLKYCNTLLIRDITKGKNEEKIKKLLKKTLSILEIVEFIPVSIQEINKIQFNRLNNQYEPYIRFCQLFLSRKALSFNISHIKSFSFLFLMHEIYQNFISRIIETNIREYLPSYSVNCQYHIGHLLLSSHGSDLYKLLPDVVISLNGEIKLIIDLKYKRLDIRKPQMGISINDINQMCVYGAKTGCSKIILLYPNFGNYSHENISTSWKIQLMNSFTAELFIRTIDLSDDLSNPNEFKRLVENIFHIIKHVIGMESLLPEREERIGSR